MIYNIFSYISLLILDCKCRKTKCSSVKRRLTSTQGFKQRMARVDITLLSMRKTQVGRRGWEMVAARWSRGELEQAELVQEPQRSRSAGGVGLNGFLYLNSLQ